MFEYDYKRIMTYKYRYLYIYNIYYMILYYMIPVKFGNKQNAFFSGKKNEGF